MTDNSAKKERLKQIILEKSLKRGSFILASGAHSNYIFDLKPTLLDPEGASLAAELFLERLSPDVTAVGGLELGACPIVSSVCVVSHTQKRPLKTFYVRKAQKDRGTKKQIEGCDLQKNDIVVIAEDVTTKGGSVIEAIKAVRAEGCSVTKVFSIIDRLQGAEKNLKKEGVELESLFTKNDFPVD